MAALIVLLLNLVASLFKPKSQLEAENAALRQQLIVPQRRVDSWVEFANSDRCSSSCCIAGFHRFSRRSRSSGPRPWCAGIVPVFAATGVASLKTWGIRRMSAIRATQLHSSLLEFLHELPQLVCIDVADREVVEAVRAPAADVVALR
jgi:hypothetical protein